MTQNGWRKPTPELLQAEKHAEVGERLTIPKTRAIVAVKKVAAAIGLKAQDLLLLDTFGAVTQAQDWEAGRRPIVWPSNNFLMQQTGFSLATLRRHVRRLGEAGVIAMKDSPNGKRWGKRDAEGVIFEAYGFDLSPLAARTEEFETLYQKQQAERAACASLRRAITITRRMIRAQIERAQEMGLCGPWQHLRETFSVLLAGLPGRSERAGALEHFLDRIKALLTSVEQSFGDATDTGEKAVENQDAETVIHENVTPSSLRNETHIQTTNEPYSLESNPDKGHNTASVVPKGQGVWPAPKAPQIDIPTLMAACPQFAEMAHATEGYLRNWTDVHRAAATLRPQIGISQGAWDLANSVLGPSSAATSVALILDKTTKSEITSPSAYLRGLVKKAQIGELHLERSVFGKIAVA